MATPAPRLLCLRVLPVAAWMFPSTGPWPAGVSDRAAPVTKGQLGIVINYRPGQLGGGDGLLRTGGGAQTLPPKFLQQAFHTKVPHFESLCRIFRQPIILHKKPPDVGGASQLSEGACDRQREARGQLERASPARRRCAS